jgi:hypothetical protein
VNNNLVTVVIVVVSAIIPYLLSQQDVLVPPVWKVILTAGNIGLLAYARLSGTTTIPEKKIGSAVQTPAGEAATVTKADG